MHPFRHIPPKVKSFCAANPYSADNATHPSEGSSVPCHAELGVPFHDDVPQYAFHAARCSLKVLTIRTPVPFVEDFPPVSFFLPVTC